MFPSYTSLPSFFSIPSLLEAKLGPILFFDQLRGSFCQWIIHLRKQFMLKKERKSLSMKSPVADDGGGSLCFPIPHSYEDRLNIRAGILESLINYEKKVLISIFCSI
jgi:hypothetical protein